ncbi:Glutamate receptor 2.7, partial [Dichanthelium oligosanthes]
MATTVRITMFLLLAFISVVAQNVTKIKAEEFHVGVVLDLGTTVGKVARTSISIAVEDFYAVHPNYTTRLVLHVRDSKHDDVQAASAANDSAQVNSIASVIKTYGWRKVVPIYIDNDYGRGIIPDLFNVLDGIDAHIPYQSAIDESATSEEITQELYKLMAMQTRVFVVHMSPSLGFLFFTKAKEIGMMSEGFVWIITDGLANLIDLLNPSAVEAMNGALGVEFYVPKSTELENFTMRW